MTAYLLQANLHFGADDGSRTSTPSSHSMHCATPSCVSDWLHVGCVHSLHPCLLCMSWKGGLL